MIRSVLAVFGFGLLLGCGGMDAAGEGPVDNLADVQAAPNVEGKEIVAQAKKVATAERTGCHATFDPYAEVVRVVDTAADNHSAVAQLLDKTTGHKRFCRAAGKGKVATCNYSIAEGHSITISACLGDGDNDAWGCKDTDSTTSLK